MAVAVVGADKRGWKRRLAPAVMLALLGASLLAACAPLGSQTVEPRVTPGQQLAEVQDVVIVPTEEPTETPTEEPTETPEPTAEPTATPEPEMGMQNEQGQWWDGTGWQSLPEGEGWQVEVLEDGQVRATDANGAEYTWVEGQWQTEAQIETQKVVEYVAENTEPINRVEMPLLEFRASDRLQEVIKDKLPDDLQALGDKPLYMIVPDVEKLTEVIGNLSIHVVGKEDKVPLAGRNVEFVFLSADEDTFTLPYYLGGGGSDAYRYGAFETEDGTVQIVIQMARYMSTFYTYNTYEMESAMASEGVMMGLQVLAEGQLSIITPHNVSSFQRRFFYDSEWDDNLPNPGRTPMIVSYVVRPRYMGPGLSRLFEDLAEQLPDEYRDLVLNLNW